jgi:hypothetical protein
MLLVSFVSRLVAQSEMDDLLDVLYGSYGERFLTVRK